MKIKVLGSGCPSCKKLFELTKQAVQELDVKSEVEYITDIQQIINLGVMSSPVMTINEKVVIAGHVPNLEKIKETITANMSDNSACCSDKDACDIECKPDNDKNTGCTCGGNC
jgi:small redox-active disulfide protein 2